MSRHYTDQEWAKIMAGVWEAERQSQVRMFMTTKRTVWSSELGREYGWVLCPIRRPSRALVVWLLENLADQALCGCQEPVVESGREKAEGQVVEGQVKRVVRNNR